jgi:hypothetical protein
VILIKKSSLMLAIREGLADCQGDLDDLQFVTHILTKRIENYQVAPVSYTPKLREALKEIKEDS